VVFGKTHFISVGKETAMKKVLVVLIVLVLLLTSVSVAFAGGDKNQGDIGTGETHEVCGTQPGCADDDAPKPGPGPDY